MKDTVKVPATGTLAQPVTLIFTDTQVGSSTSIGTPMKLLTGTK